MNLKHAGVATPRPPLIEFRNLTKNFGPVEALRGVSFSIAAGEIVGLMGDNGAGKSTLIKILSGNFAPSSGEIIFAGNSIHLSHPSVARSYGIETVYQDLALCENLSAAENIFLGREISKGGFLKIGQMQAEARALFSRLQSDTPSERHVSTLSGGQRQAVAIARAISASAKVVIFDEPTAAISVRQIAEVLRLIRILKSEGVAVILISHRMSDILESCSRVIVLRRGEKVCDKATEQTSNQELTALITGALEKA